MSRLAALKELGARYRMVFAAALDAEQAPRPERNSDEVAFLPAALELAETPPSPLPRLLLLTLCALVGIALLWACIGKVDIVAVARGKVVPSGYVKEVQSMVQGEVTAILVEDGQYVAAGSPLLRLEPTTTEAEWQQAHLGLQKAQLDARRAEVLIAAAQKDLRSPPELTAPDGVDQSLFQEQQSLLQASFLEFRSRLDTNSAEVRRLESGMATTRQMLAKIDALLPLLRERAQDYERLADKQYIPRHQLLDRQQQLREMEEDRRVQAQKLAEVATVIAKQAEQRKVLVAEFLKQQQEQLLDARARMEAAEQETIKLDQQKKWLVITAPVSGHVQELAVNTIGAVVTPAQKLLTIVPSQGGLEVEAWLENQDIGFVVPGQAATVKVDAFPFTRYGFIEGKVVNVSSDAVTQEDKGLIYKIRVRLDQDSLWVDRKKLRLTPGMAVAAEVKTGERRLISFFLSPVLQYKQESLRER